MLLSWHQLQKEKKETVTKKTFMSWDGHEDFEIEVDDEDDVNSLKCKVCSVNINEIRKEAKARNNLI